MVVYFNNFRDENYRKIINNIFNIALDQTHTKNNITVNITIVGKERIRELNKTYRNVDKTTDVLSFPLNDEYDYCSQEFKDENVQTDLGDIVICKSRAIMQAKEYGHSEKREICFLALHGLLHLLGYDHIEKKDEVIMFPLQEKILKKAEIRR